MFQLTFLGTGATVPSADRGLSALLVEHERQRFLVDCGEGTLRQIRRAHVGIRRLDHILLTHGHLDHVLGLPGIAGTIELWDQGDRLTIHGGEGALRIARTLLDEVLWPEGHPGLDVRYAPIGDGPLLQSGGVTITAFPVAHHDTESYGFVFEEEGHRPLDPQRLADLGVPSGPERHRLAHGETVRLADGRTVRPEDVLGPAERGARLAVVGDAERTDTLVDAVRKVDLLVIEATYMTRDEETARSRGHLTVRDACRLAEAAGVARLVLTHQSARYDPADVAAEARALFPNVTIAADFDRIRVQESTST